MPGFTTHYILGMKAYNDLPNNQLKYIIAKYRWLYQIGLQGPDIFFYNIPILRHRDYRNVGSHMHDVGEKVGQRYDDEYFAEQGEKDRLLLFIQ